MTEAEIQNYFSNLLILSGRLYIAVMMLPIMVAIYNYFSLNKPLKIFLGFCVTTISINILEHTFVWATGSAYYYPFLKQHLDYWQIESTSFLQILYYLRDFFFLGWFYSILTPKKYNIWIKWITGILFVATLINYFFIEGYKILGVFNPAADAIFSFTLPAFYVWYLFRYVLIFPIYKNSYFWLSFALIFANLVGLFLYIIGDTVHKEYYLLFLKLSIARNAFDMISQIIITIGFWNAPYAKYIPLPENEDIGKQKAD